MRNIRLNIAYDGTGFCGWQIQPNQITVQGEIEKALSVIHKEHVDLIGSGRTDSGVHADLQVANFTTNLDSIPEKKFAKALNSLLPLDIRILDSFEVPSDFHSRFSAIRRTYKYYLKIGEVGHPKNRDFSYLIHRPINLAHLNNLAMVLLGEHDFTAFAASMDQAPTKIRTIYSASFYPEDDFIVFKICGNAFLQRMVRSITGTLLDLCHSGGTPEDLKKILDSRDRGLAGTTAPSRGLFLHLVEYNL